jgi:hypothetical protein
MIKIENNEVYGWEAAIRGMRNPMNSWGKSDSGRCDCNDCFHIMHGTEPGIECNDGEFGFCIGENDLALMKKLVKAGTDHRKFLRMINVTVDITAPLYWWKEFDTYKVGTVRDSCSTMHKITAKEFTIDDFSHEHLFPGEYGEETPTDILQYLICALNKFRELYLKSHDKNYWWQIIQLLPSSYNQRATVQLNYEVLLNMYHSRKNHKLDEWRTFCEWIESLPYMGEFLNV